MKILVLILGKKDNSIYSKLEHAIRNTWLQRKPKNIDVIFYYGNGNNTLIGDELSLNIQDTYSNISLKTLMMYEYIYNNMNNYDYIFRTNLSSYVDLQLLNEFLIDKPKEKFYCGIKGLHNKIEFASGSGYFLSKDLLELIIRNKKDWDTNLIDDVSLGKLMQKHNITIDKSAKRIDIIFENGINLKKDNYHYRCKQKNRINDLKIIYNIYENK